MEVVQLKSDAHLQHHGQILEYDTTLFVLSRHPLLKTLMRLAVYKG